ncbi:arsenate reductase/protein-tyrosine-phosphatase family protein [Cellulomonas bogoriensis]|uniref:Protein tyrosine phosphatase n=1 Tax=Cellulomonas bogoriensis 69B4 = DSM 16987 TaxID=1386082 RepID=A0A0A0BMQ3_9CELL|nr:hypothetical protein [Cellulomonas bogoriensis]KGM08997.1 protein tyrosine phosphatase [Cellulomonas bogoriensis 69B4 = DSM 16987]
MSADRPARVLVVCTGNICRSPAGERLLRAHLAPDGGIEVTSAGTHAMVGSPVADPMAALLVGDGVDVTGFSARQLTAPMVKDADLVITMTRAHRSAVARTHPAAVRRTFTLRELARYITEAAAHDDADTTLRGRRGLDRVETLVPLVAARRGRTRVEADQDEVVDPYGGDHALYDRSYAQLRPAVLTVVGALTGP